MKIKLLKDHRHAGINYSAGDTLEMDIDTANYLADLKVALPIGDTAKQPDSVKDITQKSRVRGNFEPVLGNTPSADTVGVVESTGAVSGEVSGDTPIQNS